MDLGGDYERMLGMLHKAGVPFKASRDHEVLTIGERGETTLRFDSWGALLSWETKQE